MHTKFSRNFNYGRPAAKHLIADVFITAAALYLSLFLRIGGNTDGNIDGDIQANHFATLQNFLIIFITIRIAALYFHGVYKTIWRYSSLVDLTLLLRAIILSNLMFIAASYLMRDFGQLPRSVFFIDFFISMAGLGGARLLNRLKHERRGQKKMRHTDAQNVIIYGAGENGRILANRLNNDFKLNQKLIGFIDDDPKKTGKSILGFPILGSGAALENLIRTHNIDMLILSVTNAHPNLIREVLSQTRKFNIVPQVYNHFAEKTNGSANIFREVSLYDLLSRKTADIDYSSIKNLVSGKTVLVTGAGGSIGSELSRQLQKYKPKCLLLLDHSEFNLYTIDHELRLTTTQHEKIIPLLTDIKDKTSLAQVFSSYKPEIVFHAAAYKHVHLVEYNAPSAILNNVMGTLNLIELCEQFQVNTFLNISTDKAVNPVGVMGATKRVCELLVNDTGLTTGRGYSSVRFGNVLGSSGSLIPLLTKQIQEGGPLTITHPDMKRYFMLIPEAVSLVLTSVVLSKPGDINVLNMGEQVKILDLAKSLITLSGKTEDEIKIIFTGLRPGEKMFEEMYINGNELQTSHPDILTLPHGDNAAADNDIKNQVLALIEYAKINDPRALILLKKLACCNVTT